MIPSFTPHLSYQRQKGGGGGLLELSWFFFLHRHEQEFQFLLSASPHCVLLLILRGGNFGEGQSGPSLPARWPWVPDRYKSVGAGQHSSEQVNRASSNPLGGPQSAPTQQRLLQMLTFANTKESGILEKQNPPFLRESSANGSPLALF